MFLLIAVHLYVFYFGLMADITPPVGLASYAAAAISRADPIQTGIQAFWYSLRTAILPIVFIFNHELLLIGIEDWIHALVVISTSLIAILVFTAATQRWFMTQMRWYEVIAFLIIAMSLFRPGFILDQFYPEYNTKNLSSENIRLATFKPDEMVRIKITRQSNYGKRYKLFEIPENKFNKDFQIKDLGIEVSDKEGKLVIEFLQWNAVATQVGLVVGDTIDEFKTVNPDRPNKAIIYPFALLLLLIFGYSNFRRSKIA